MPAFAVPADFANKISGLGNTLDNIPSEISEKIKNNDQSTNNNSDNNTSETTEESGDVIDATPEEIEAASSVMTNPDDQKIVRYQSLMTRLGWNNSDQEHRKQIFEKINSLKEALKQNQQALEDNYQNMKDKENSFENRMLGGLAMGTVGIGGMMAAQSLAEQNADDAAERDMRAYLATFQCKVGDQTYSGGTQKIEVAGANQLINLYQEYAKLAGDLKERKSALGMKAGIESEVVIDKATSGLYNDVGTGIGSGAYASIARALQNPNGEDAKRWAEQKESTSNTLKTGAIMAGAGAIASMAANYAINHGNKDKSGELLSERTEIQQELDDVIEFELDECNAKIQERKSWADEQKKSPEYSTSVALQEEIAEIESLKYLDSVDDIYKLEGHPVCY